MKKLTLLWWGAGALGVLAAGSAAVAWWPASGPKLDSNLGPSTAKAVTIALARESDPSRLEAFGRSLLPDYPLACEALLARAAVLRKASPTVGVDSATDVPDRILPGQTLLKRTDPLLNRIPHIQSPNGDAVLVLQDDGNLVLSSWAGDLLWSSKTNGRGVVAVTLEKDGNLSYKNAKGENLVAPGEAHPGGILILQNDGNLVATIPGTNTAYWSTDSYGFVDRQDKGPLDDFSESWDDFKNTDFGAAVIKYIGPVALAALLVLAPGIGAFVGALSTQLVAASGIAASLSASALAAATVGVSVSIFTIPSMLATRAVDAIITKSLGYMTEKFGRGGSSKHFPPAYTGASKILSDLGFSSQDLISPDELQNAAILSWQASEDQRRRMTPPGERFIPTPAPKIISDPARYNAATAKRDAFAKALTPAKIHAYAVQNFVPDEVMNIAIDAATRMATHDATLFDAKGNYLPDILAQSQRNELTDGVSSVYSKWTGRVDQAAVTKAIGDLVSAMTKKGATASQIRAALYAPDAPYPWAGKLNPFTNQLTPANYKGALGPELLKVYTSSLTSLPATGNAAALDAAKRSNYDMFRSVAGLTVTIPSDKPQSVEGIQRAQKTAQQIIHPSGSLLALVAARDAARSAAAKSTPVPVASAAASNSNMRAQYVSYYLGLAS